MSGDDLLQSLEAIVDGWLIKGCNEKKIKIRNISGLISSEKEKEIIEKSVYSTEVISECLI